MVDDRGKRRSGFHGVTFRRPGTQPGTPVGSAPPAVAEEIDDGPTPLPTNEDEAEQWQHVGARVTRLELGHQAFAQSFPRLEALLNELVLPLLKKAVADVDGLLQRQERNSTRLELFFDEQWPKLTDAVDQLAERLARVEKKQDSFVSELALHNDRIGRAEKRLDEIERQLGAINLERRDRSVIATERRRWLSWGKAAYALAVAVAGAAGYLISQLNP